MVFSLLLQEHHKSKSELEHLEELWSKTVNLVFKKVNYSSENSERAVHVFQKVLFGFQCLCEAA